METRAVRFATVVMLVAAALIGTTAGLQRYAIGLLLFGVLNVFLAQPGSQVVRAAAIGLSLWGLAFPPAQFLVTFIAWLIWLPAFAAAATIGAKRVAHAADDESSALDQKISVSALIAAVALGSIAYRLFVQRHVEQTAALFVGIPAVIAIVVVYVVSPRSATGVACKAVTVGLLLSLMLLWEGALCVVMAAPLFFAIAIVVAQASELAQRNHEHTKLFSSAMVLAIVPLALEGVTPFTTIDRRETVSASRVVAAPAAEVERALFEKPRFDRVPSRYLRAGFPSPVATRIERNRVGTRWTIQIRGGEMRINGMEPRTGDLVLELADWQPGLVRWRAVSDTSHMTHFLLWREAEVRWEPLGARTTRVTWTIRYDRGLDPAWYFGPLEKFVTGIAAGYLIDTVATP